jgi:type VI secretion system secreted protein Hcp
MAVDMFIKIKDIKGEAKDAKHPDEIDVLAWSWGLSQTGTTHYGGGGGSGKANVQDLSFTKRCDKSTSALMYHCVSGKHIQEAVFVARKAGEKPVEYLKLKLFDILVTSVSTGGSGNEDYQTENVTLNFAKFNLEYYEQKPDGTAGGVSGQVGWDIKKNEKA